MAIVNRYNFIRWSDAPSTPGVAGDFSEVDFDADDFLTAIPAAAPYEDLGDLPRPYWWDAGRCGYMPVLTEGDVMAFYLNTKDGLDLGTFSDLRLRVIDGITGSTLASGFTVLYQDLISVGFYNVYANFYVPALPNGYVRLQIYKNSDDSVVLTSNMLLSSNDSEIRNQTALCRFRNERYFYHVRYSNLPGFYQQFRLHINVIERQPETDRETYTEVTTGKTRTTQAYLRRYYRFETYYFDPAAHEAATIMIEHNFVEFNAMRFKLKTPYKEPADQRTMIGKGEFEMYDDDYATANRCVITPILVLGDGEGYAIGDGEGNVVRVR
jgi:hypothetical protein